MIRVEIANFAVMNNDLYIFNPDSDLALAYGVEGYTAPPHARQLRRDLQMLPAWYCSDGATILSQNCEEDRLWLERMKNLLGIDARCIDINHLQNHRFRYNAWGWNLDLRQRLINENVPMDNLPSREWVNNLRGLSHRAISVKIHEYLRSVIDYPFPPLPVEVRSVEDIQKFEHKHPKCYIKAPWSSSGRGVYRVLEPQSRNFITWAQGIINRQGSIMCEHACDGVMDFALEYRCENAKAEFAGYSVFSNDSHSSFDSGIVAKGEILRTLITDKLGNDSNILDRVKDEICNFIEQEIAPYYNGYLGVDMMLYRDEEGNIRLNPCVELNLRMTMGVVTAIFGEKYLAEGSTGIFRVEYAKKGGVAEKMAKIVQENPIVEERGKIKTGLLPIVPVYDTSKYCAYMQISRK